MFFAIFDDATSSTYGSTGDRPVKLIATAPDTVAMDLQVSPTEDYISITDFIQMDQYKITWSGSVWQLATRATINSIATWNKTMITANGVDSCTLGPSLPNPTTLYIELSKASKLSLSADPVAIVTTGSFTLTTQDPGTYTVRIINKFPYAPYEQVITAT